THLLASQVIAVLWYSLARTIVLLASFAPQWKGIDGRFSGRGGVVYFAGTGSFLLGGAHFFVVFVRGNAIITERRVLESTMLARDAELKALKAQLNPHFLFNSLNSISALTSIDPSRARDMCVLLGDFLRTTLRVGEHPVIPFSEELGLIERFLSIE